MLLFYTLRIACKIRIFCSPYRSTTAATIGAFIQFPHVSSYPFAQFSTLCLCVDTTIVFVLTCALKNSCPFLHKVCAIAARFMSFVHLLTLRFNSTLNIHLYFNLTTHRQQSFYLQLVFYVSNKHATISFMALYCFCQVFVEHSMKILNLYCFIWSRMRFLFLPVNNGFT